MKTQKLSYALFKDPDFRIKDNTQAPEEKVFLLPEKILQFGTGGTIRGIPDFFIDKANKNGIFNGRIVAIESENTSVAQNFADQDGLFVHHIKGVENDINVNNCNINASISRVLNPDLDWAEILKCAYNPDLSIILSDATAFHYKTVDTHLQVNHLSSFPAKLTAFLYERFKAFNGAKESGMIIIATEPFADNGLELKESVFAIADQNLSENTFLDWLENENTFCNSSIDGLVTEHIDHEEIETKTGFQDALTIISEPYKFWAIECADNIKDKLSFYKADESVIITKDIKEYRERELRLLKGLQTILTGLGFLSRFNTIQECLEDSLLNEFVKNLMLDEIIPVMDVNREAAESFANALLDRFNNPFIHQSLLEISAQYSFKMNSRNSKTIIKFYKRYLEVPRFFALAFAAYLIFMKAEKLENGKYFGQRDEEFYQIEDDFAPFFYEKWKTADVNTINSCKIFVEEIIDEGSFWDLELKAIPGFSDAVAHSLCEIAIKGIKETLEELVEFGEIEE